MSQKITFANAPISEAILDIQVQLPESFNLGDLELVHNDIKNRFPEKTKKMFLKAGFEVKPGEELKAGPSLKGEKGFIFRSSSDKKLVQMNIDGFTFNKLNPYENWQAFRDEARELWTMYIDVAKPIKITRLALRYINRIEMPLPIKDFKEYVLTGPEIAADLPQALANFFMQLFIPHEKSNMKAIINQTLEPPVKDSILPFIFDIDVFQEVDLKCEDKEIWDTLELLRGFKNDIFLKSTTDKAKELFK